MTVKELRELLEEAPDDMMIMISAENHIHPGVIAFRTPCPCETGIADLCEGTREDDPTEAFLILPHGFLAHGDNFDRQSIPQAN